MTLYSDVYASRTQFTFVVDVSLNTQDVAGNRSKYDYRVYAEHTSGTVAALNKYYDPTKFEWGLRITSSSLPNGGNVYSGKVGMLFGPTGDEIGKQITFAAGTTDWIDHNAAGDLTLIINAHHYMDTSVFGKAQINETPAGDHITRVPQPPVQQAPSNVQSAQFVVNFTPPTNIGGSPITSYQLQTSPVIDFSSGVVTTTVTPGQVVSAGVAPNTKYFTRVRAVNTQGASDWSNIQTLQMAPSSGAASIAVIERWDKTGFYIICQPPFGISAGSVDSYTIRRTVTGPSPYGPFDWTGRPPAPNLDAITLYPDQVVTYSAVAIVGGVPSPRSPEVAVQYKALKPHAPLWPIFGGGDQPASPFTPYDTASWEGTADASITKVLGRVPDGWRTFAEGASDLIAAGGTVQGVVVQAPAAAGMDAYKGAVQAMAVFGRTQSAAGFRLGTAINGLGLVQKVYPGLEYFAYIKGGSDVHTQLACELEFYDQSFQLISRTRGPVLDSDPWYGKDLNTSAVAPVGAAYAAVTTVDVNLGGSYIWNAATVRFAGDAMINATTRTGYFDAGFAPDDTYSYEWLDDPNSSPSLRTTADTVSITDPLAPQVPAAPQIPVPDNITSISDIVWQRSVALIPAGEIREWISAVPTLQLTANDAARAVRVRYWRNPEGTLPADWTQAEGQDPDFSMFISYIPQYATFTIDGVEESAWVTLTTGGSAGVPQPADHLLYGDDQDPVIWPSLLCGDAYIITLDIDVSADPGNIVMTLDLTDRLL